jgi:hypothetical protein
MKEEVKKKNILDLQFQKYLVVASTSIILAFTYTIGVCLAFFTGQIMLNDFVSMSSLFFISAGILGICAILFFNASNHLRVILRILKNL